MERHLKHGWFPTKAERWRGRWRARRAGPVVSRLAADLQIAGYERVITQNARGILLDLGCGNAPFAGIYAHLVERYEWADWPNSPHQIFGLDHEVNLNRLPLPLLSNAYDTILLSDVLEHIAEPDALLHDLHRILRPGGCLIIGVPFLYPIHEQPHDHHRYTRYQLEYFAHKHDFMILSLEEIGGPLDVLVDLSAKILGAIWSPLARLPYLAWLMLRSFGPLNGANTRAAPKAPLAYLAVFKKPGESDFREAAIS